MTINEERSKEINEKYIKISKCDEKWSNAIRVGISVCGDGISKTNICGQGWEICPLNELSRMITALQTIQSIIEDVTGLKC